MNKPKACGWCEQPFTRQRPRRWTSEDDPDTAFCSEACLCAFARHNRLVVS